MSQLGLKQYQSVNQQSAAAYADPHQLIQMLYDGLIERLNAAKGVIENSGGIENKGNLISRSITILGALRAYLNHEKGGELANNLASLYDYMERRLFDANYFDDVAIIEEVIGLVEELSSGWTEIREQALQSFGEPDSSAMMSSGNNDRLAAGQSPSLNVSG